MQTVLNGLLHHPSGPYDGNADIEVSRLLAELTYAHHLLSVLPFGCSHFFSKSQFLANNPPQSAKPIPNHLQIYPWRPTYTRSYRRGRWILARPPHESHSKDLHHQQATSSIFFVVDYGFKQFSGYSYDIQFENNGEDIVVFDMACLLEMVTGAELVVVVN